MDSQEIRKMRALERINQILKEENCSLETKVTIIGSTIADTQVLVFARPTPAVEPVQEEGIVVEKGPVEEPQKEGETA